MQQAEAQLTLGGSDAAPVFQEEKQQMGGKVIISTVVFSAFFVGYYTDI